MTRTLAAAHDDPWNNMSSPCESRLVDPPAFSVPKLACTLKGIFPKRIRACTVARLAFDALVAAGAAHGRGAAVRLQPG